MFRGFRRRGSVCFQYYSCDSNINPFNAYFSIHLCRNRSYYLYCVHPKQNKTKAFLCAADSKRSDKYGLTDISNKSNKWWFEDFSNKLNSKSNSKCCQKSFHWFDKYCKWKQCVLEWQLRNWFLKLKSYSVMIWKIILHFKSLLRTFIQIKNINICHFQIIFNNW